METLDRVADALVRGQREDGNFSSRSDNMMLNGNSRALVGLLEHYRSTGEARCLAAARRLADWYIETCGPEHGNSSFLTMVLEGFVELWQETGEEPYLAYARVLAAIGLEIWTDPLPEEGHFHSMLATLRAMTDLAIRSGDAPLLERAEGYWELLQRDSVWISGGMPEISPNSIEADEPCTTGDWLRFCLLLWKATGKNRYLEAAERTLVNHLTFNQLPNGGFSSTSNLEQGFRGLEAWWCCSMQAPRSILEMTRYIWTHKRGVLYLNFFLPSKTVIPLKRGNVVTVVQETDFPHETRSRITVDPEKTDVLTLKIRVPQWCSGKPVRTRINGRAVEAEYKGDRLVLRRRWQRGDCLEISLPALLRLESDCQGKHEKWSEPTVTLAGSKVQAKRVGLFCGPLLSAVIRTNHQNDMSWVYRGGYNEGLDTGGMQGSDGSSRNYFRINGRVYDDQSGGRQVLQGLAVAARSGSFVMTWKERLPGQGGPVAEIHYRRVVHGGTPLVVEEEETLVVLGRKTREVVVEEALMAGIRLSRRTEQYHDTYTRIWKYEYPPLLVGSSRGRLKEIEDGKRRMIRPVVLDNGLFRVEVEVEGSASHLRTVRKERWAGLYVSALGRSQAYQKRSALEVKTTLRFPFEPYSERKFMPAEWTAGLMTQPINQAAR